MLKLLGRPGRPVAYSASTAIAGTITRWEWSVTQPDGEPLVFLPSASSQDVVVPIINPGFYEFRLKVWDAAGHLSCLDAVSPVLVLEEAAIRVEVVWETPGAEAPQDPEDPDAAPIGGDLDLHFLHGHANGRYFARPEDCNWSNRTPDWGVSGEANDPSVLRDDMDGDGPEIIQLKQPEDNVTYRVGVHYWDDEGLGDSLATIRIYINGELRDTWSGVSLTMADLWDAFTIAWPSGTITRIMANGGPKIVPNTSPF